MAMRDDLPRPRCAYCWQPRSVTGPCPMRGLVRLTGQLAVGRLEDDDGRVSWVRLQLAPMPFAV